MFRKVLVALAAVALATVAGVAFSPGAGAQYPPFVCTVTVSPTSASPGDTVTLSGSLSDSPTPKGPVAGQEISFSIDGNVIGSATTADDGTFGATVTIPVDLAPGSYTIVADCGPGPDGEILGNTDIMVTGTSNTTAPNNGGNGNNNGGNGNNGGGSGNNGAGNGGNGSNAGGGNLARTGTDLGLPVQIGIALLALGGIALALSASRRRTATA